MARSMRIAAVGGFAAALGMAITATAFTLFDVAHSDAAIGSLALLLCAANFVALRRGLAWAVRATPTRIARTATSR